MCRSRYEENDHLKSLKVSPTRDFSSRERKLLVAACVVFIFWIAYWIVTPKIEELHKKSEELALAEEYLVKQKNLQIHRTDLDRLKREREILIKRIPIKNPTSDFVEDLEIWCHATDVSIQSLNLPAPTSQGSLPFRIHLKGELQDLIPVLSFLEHYPLGLDLGDVKFDSMTNSPKGEWELWINLTIYYIE